ncbi:NAD(P)/FAD-dependent oxidoreductase [Kitasatospora sp. McL0602]|uniref:NAD(P)/FAD-dependent oxidoreductase n=1 Tax=Kitasatospora sp. McL0602 TaxID=3439530 RepID=UPI003F8958BF
MSEPVRHGRRALVVGAGVFGLSVARELAGRGWRVTVVDRHPPGTVGPSTAESRILRCAHGEDEWYARSTAEALAGWQELAAELRQELFVESGVLHFADAADPDGQAWARAGMAVLARLGVPTECIPGGELAARFPGFAGTGLAFAVHEPRAGVLLARRAVLALAESARRRGVRIRQGEARPGGAAGEAGRGSVLVDGGTAEADLVVWAVGAALPGLFPGLTGVVAEQQTSYFLTVPAAVAPSSGTAAPAWIDLSREVYGVPAVGSAGVKVVLDEAVAPDAAARPELPDRLRAYLRERLPGLADAPVSHREECTYAWSPDGHFLLDRLPGSSGAWLVGGDSGHGFKHGPAWGRYVCDVLEGRAEVEPRFALTAKAPRVSAAAPIAPNERVPNEMTEEYR